tara:strand:- start:328 stop:561 length:234 start_codon:yes stop_codon:yes gene_type:complete
MGTNAKHAHTSVTFENVERDITFLQQRLELMQHQNKQNRALLETYRNMLDSRLKVRTLLTEKYSNLKGTGPAAFVTS